MRLAWVVTVLGLLLPGASRAEPPAVESDECWIQPDSLPKGTPRFQDHPVPTPRIPTPAPVVVRGNPAAQGFRTRLRTGAVDGPNFAGHYTIVAWGCGASCIDWGVVDAVNGQVSFAPDFRSVSADHVEDPDSSLAPFDGVDRTTLQLRFRRDSSLLIVLGIPNEDLSREGANFYRWDGHAFHSVGFVPRSAFCALPRPPPAPERVQFKGHVVSDALGFSVDMPSGYFGEADAPPAPQRGFTVSLSVASRMWLDVQPEPASPTPLKLNARLGTEPAELTVWTDEDHLVHRRYRARASAREGSRLYTMQLDTRPSLLTQDRPVFEALARSFRASSALDGGQHPHPP